jgi:hypothetical protein
VVIYWDAEPTTVMSLLQPVGDLRDCDVGEHAKPHPVQILVVYHLFVAREADLDWILPVGSSPGWNSPTFYWNNSPKYQGCEHLVPHNNGKFELWQGLVNVPFWGFWTSPSNICWKLYPQYLGDIQLGHLPTPDIESYAFMYAAYICILCMRVCRYSLHMYDAGQCRSWTSAVIWVNSS